MSTNDQYNPADPFVKNREAIQRQQETRCCANCKHYALAVKRITRMEAENKRLRDALQAVIDSEERMSPATAKSIARKALEAQ
jgi:hypothetical protein